MIIDPWGKVLADCGGVGHELEDDEEKGSDNVRDDDFDGVVKVAPIDLQRLKKIRREMPIWSHRRRDVYGEIQAKFTDNENLQQQQQQQQQQRRFGDNVVLTPGVVFAETPLSFAFVNRKPVLPGHVLIAPKRVVKRMKEVGF